MQVRHRILGTVVVTHFLFGRKGEGARIKTYKT